MGEGKPGVKVTFFITFNIKIDKSCLLYTTHANMQHRSIHEVGVPTFFMTPRGSFPKDENWNEWANVFLHALHLKLYLLLHLLFIIYFKMRDIDYWPIT